MNLDNAAAAHALWKTKLRAAIAKQTQLDVVTLSRDDCCELGQWLHGEGKSSYGRLAAHGECMHKHLVFHSEVTKVARVVNAGRYGEAETLLGVGSGFAKASSALSVAFLKLRKDAGV